MKKSSILVFVGGIALLVGAWAYTQAEGEEIQACVNRAGLVRLLGYGFRGDECKRGETLVSWNQDGEKGEKGDKGDKGEKGDKGDPGDVGPMGPAGSGIRVVDNDGNLVGYLIDHFQERSKFYVRLFLPDSNLIAAYHMLSGDHFSNCGECANAGGTLWYEQNNCTGQPHAITTDAPYLTVKTEAAPGTQDFTFYKANDFSDVEQSITLNSYLNAGTCHQQNKQNVTAIKVYEFDVPTFTGPMTIVE
jgi:hypothetical protein